MNFPALLISDDDAAAAALTEVLSDFGGYVVRCGHAEAANRLPSERFAVVVVDFDDSLRGSRILRNAQKASSSLILKHAQEAIPGHHAITVALLAERTQVREILGAGAHFILYKPITEEGAREGLRAAAALIRHDRRQSVRVPLQMAVELKSGEEAAQEGILLDLSSEGLDVLVQKKMIKATPLEAHFVLPAGMAIDVKGEVAWSNANGETGVRFLELTTNMHAAIEEWVAGSKRQIPPPDPEESIGGKLTDLSLGACYVETASPFPEKSGVTLCLQADGVEADADGMVRVMHPGAGMGIEFSGKTVGERAQVANFIGFLTASPGVVPEFTVRPRAADVVAEAERGEAAEEMDDPLLSLIQHPERLSEEEFLQELRSQRGAAV
ncbi:MAG TPA: PilZ domain-containing protein [Terriglobales bacterium]